MKNIWEGRVDKKMERTEGAERTGNGTICKIKAENHYRHELKYMVSYWQYLQLRSRFRQVMKTDPHTGEALCGGRRKGGGDPGRCKGDCGDHP